MQWVRGSNTLVYNGEPFVLKRLTSMIKKLDIPLKQALIEVLVIETDVRNSSEFGLKWSLSGKHGDYLKGDIHSPSIPTKGKAFELSVIGDLILHKGKTFLNLTDLITAIDKKGDNSIILNQKLIAQDNQKTEIFVGDNLPFPSSKVETIGAAQQTTSNIEYKDVGVKLVITPLIGTNETITLEIAEEISEAKKNLIDPSAGIETTKTNMITRVHIPNDKFLILSGLTKNKQRIHKTGVPCLGSIPLLGLAFSHTQKEIEKRNVIIFVKPKIIQGETEWAQMTKKIKEEHHGSK